MTKTIFRLMRIQSSYYLPTCVCDTVAVGISSICFWGKGGGPVPSIWFNNCVTIESSPLWPQT